MTGEYKRTKFYIDFSNHANLTHDQKTSLERIQEQLKPLERVDMLTPYRLAGDITDDEYHQMTGTPYSFD